MAACRSRACSGGCLPPSRGCDRRAKWSDSLLSGKGLSDDSSHRGLLQEWASLSRSVGGDATMAGAEGTRRGKPEAESREPAEPEEPEEMPLVFLCGGCRRPLGDSLSWVASQEDSNCILLRSVSSNVSVDKEQVLSKRKNENGCVLETLSCAGCSLRLGFIYRYTPKSLDYKRDLFCLSVEAVESYTLGSSEKQIVSDDKELFTLESRVEIEKSLKQMEDVLKVLETKLWEVESKLAFAGRKA